jgi:hypothetical protein
MKEIVKINLWKYSLQASISAFTMFKDVPILPKSTTLEILQCHSSGGWLAAGFSPQRPGLNTRAVHIQFVVGKVALGQVSLSPAACFMLVSSYSLTLKMDVICSTETLADFHHIMWRIYAKYDNLAWMDTKTVE